MKPDVANVESMYFTYVTFLYSGDMLNCWFCT